MQLLINNMQYLDEKFPGIHSENSKYKFYSSKARARLLSSTEISRLNNAKLKS